MKTKTSYYVCPNYFIHKKRAQLNTMLFLFSFDGNYITKVSLLCKQRSLKAYLCTIADYQFKERGQHFLSDFSAKNSLYTIFSLIERRFPQLEPSLRIIKSFYGILVTLLACLLLKDIILIQASKVFSFSIRLPEDQFTLAMSLPFKQK